MSWGGFGLDVPSVSALVFNGFISVTNFMLDRPRPDGLARRLRPLAVWNSYLVDPASSHMLVSKIKPCMSKYKRIHTVKLRMAH